MQIWGTEIFDNDDKAALCEVIGSKVLQVKWLLDLQSILGERQREGSMIDERLDQIISLCKSVSK